MEVRIKFVTHNRTETTVLLYSCGGLAYKQHDGASLLKTNEAGNAKWQKK